MLCREGLIERLLALPGAIAVCELELLEAETARGHFQAHLTTVEDQLLLGGTLDGKNAETRAAQMRTATMVCREQLDEVQATLARRKVSLHHLQTEHSSLKAIARLMAAE